jgi:hypothetical protein
MFVYLRFLALRMAIIMLFMDKINGGKNGSFLTIYIKLEYLMYKKKTIKLKESELRRIIAESVRNI